MLSRPAPSNAQFTPAMLRGKTRLNLLSHNVLNIADVEAVSQPICNFARK